MKIEDEGAIRSSLLILEWKEGKLYHSGKDKESKKFYEFASSLDQR